MDVENPPRYFVSLRFGVDDCRLAKFVDAQVVGTVMLAIDNQS